MSQLAAQQAMQEAAAHARAGRPADAERLFRQAVALAPDDPGAHASLGLFFASQGRLQEAGPHLARWAALQPQSPEAHYNLGKALRDVRQLEPAASEFRAALRLNPALAPAWNNLGNTLRDLDRLDEAMNCYSRSLTLAPDHAPTHHNLAVLLKDLLRTDDAMAEFDFALRLKPEYHEAAAGKAMLQLLLGDYANGWRGYETRWRIPESFPPRDFRQPVWDGSDVSGKTILLHAEQGFGDTIQFCRYAPLVAERAATVIIECQPPLAELLKTLAGMKRVIARGEPLPDFDLHCPLLGLPLRFGTTVETIPAPVPYLHSDEERVARWRERIDGQPGLRVGLAWAGAAGYGNDQRRSLGLASFAPLANIEGLRWFSLQKGDAAAQAAQPPGGMRLIDFTTDLHNFADTAGLIANLDLLISVDTAVAHLGGALGKPVWTLLPFCPDWRWLLGRDDSPWYPTMRLFRQPVRGDWSSVVQRVAEELQRAPDPSGPLSPRERDRVRAD